MGYYVRQAGGFPPKRLVTLLESYEATCGLELLREHPDVEMLMQLQEEIEDAADVMEITILWEARSTGPVAVLYGNCFGIYHMPYADPDRCRV